MRENRHRKSFFNIGSFHRVPSPPLHPLLHFLGAEAKEANRRRSLAGQPAARLSSALELGLHSGWESVRGVRTAIAKRNSLRFCSRSRRGCNHLLFMSEILWTIAARGLEANFLGLQYLGSPATSRRSTCMETGKSSDKEVSSKRPLASHTEVVSGAPHLSLWWQGRGCTAARAPPASRVRSF
jgi:hypothetical protein